MLHSLLPHTPAEGRIDVRLSRADAGDLMLEYSLALADLCLPGPAPRVHSDGLWRRTCCEAFIAPGDGVGYREFNFSPSGAFAGYAFQGYRAGQQTLAFADPGICLEQSGAVWTLRARIEAAALPAGLSATPLRVGLCAVIEDTAGRIRYWALRHPPGKPDFHHPDGFVLELA